jgi:hypothetical protein
MKNTIFLIFLLVLIGCRNDSSIGGIYKSKDGKISSIVYENSLALIKGTDTLISYSLTMHRTDIYLDDTIRNYMVGFEYSLCPRGYEKFKNPFVFEYDSLLGGTLTAVFFDDDLFNIGGNILYRVDNENDARLILLNWSDLIKNNNDQLEYDEREQYEY